MSPEEKAYDILVKFIGCQPVKTIGTTTVRLVPPDKELAKRSAIICVEKILNVFDTMPLQDATRYYRKSESEYWNQVLDILKTK